MAYFYNYLKYPTSGHEVVAALTKEQFPAVKAHPSNANRTIRQETKLSKEIRWSNILTTLFFLVHNVFPDLIGDLLYRP